MNRHPALLAFLKLFIPLSALFLGGLLLFDQFQATELVREIQKNSQRGLAMETGALDDGLQGHYANSLILAELVRHEMADHLGEINDHPHLSPLFKLFLEARPSYLRAQALLSGQQETVGAERRSPGASPVPAGSLGVSVEQALCQRALALPPGRVLVDSHFRPPSGAAAGRFTPFWRITALVTRADGRPQGMVVLDLTGADQLAGIRSRAITAGSTLYLVDLAGGGILRTDPGGGWSALPPGATPAGLGDRLPEAWKRVLGQTEGQFLTDHGLITFGTIHAGFASGPGGAPARKRQDSRAPLLKTVIEVPASKLASTSRVFTPLFIVPILALLTSFLWPWAVARTRRREAERALHENEQTVLAVSRSLRDAVIVVDEADRIKFWNPAAQAMFGYTRQEMMDQAVQLLVTDQPEEVRGAGTLGYHIRALLNHREEGLRRFTARRKDGSRFPVEVSVSSMFRNGRQFNVGILRDISRRVETERKLVELATTDPLTGLLNRRRFMELAREELARAGRYGHHVSLLMLDLDRFKSVNDTHGHQAGDLVLCELARVVQRGLRQVDVMGRIGGEEFAVLMPETDVLQALVAAERLRRAVEASAVEADEVKINFTVSIGVAQAAPGEQTTLRLLFKLADDALYQAKDTGRNRVQAA